MIDWPQLDELKQVLDVESDDWDWSEDSGDGPTRLTSLLQTAIAKVKQVYGGLSNLEQEALRRVNVAKRLAPESLTEQIAGVHAAGELIEGIATGHPLSAIGRGLKGTAYRQAARMIKERNTSDYLISKAFKNFGEYVEQAQRGHRVIPAAVGAARSAGQGGKP